MTPAMNRIRQKPNPPHNPNTPTAGSAVLKSPSQPCDGMSAPEADRPQHGVERPVDVVHPGPGHRRHDVGDDERQEQQQPEEREAADPDPGQHGGEEQPEDDRQERVEDHQLEHVDVPGADRAGR